MLFLNIIVLFYFVLLFLSSATIFLHNLLLALRCVSGRSFHGPMVIWDIDTAWFNSNQHSFSVLFELVCSLEQLQNSTALFLKAWFIGLVQHRHYRQPDASSSLSELGLLVTFSFVPVWSTKNNIGLLSFAIPKPVRTHVPVQCVCVYVLTFPSLQFRGFREWAT